MNGIKKRRSRRYAVAMSLGCDLADVEEYQPGQTKVPVFLAGDRYIVALRDGELVPPDFGEWVARYPEEGYSLWITTGK